MRWWRRGGCSIQKEASTDVFSPGSRWPRETGYKNKERSDTDCDGGKKTEFTDNLENGMKKGKTQNARKMRKGARTSESTNPTYLRKNQQAPKNKSKISTQFNFIPLSMMFEKIDKKPTELGSNDRGS